MVYASWYLDTYKATPRPILAQLCRDLDRLVRSHAMMSRSMARRRRNLIKSCTGRDLQTILK